MSRLPETFHVVFYLPLAAAAACLTFAALFFLGWMPLLLLGFWALLFLAYRMDGRWYLSESAANRLGILIGLGTIGWIVLQIPRYEEELVERGLPWPAGLLPHLAPLLVVLLSVKLFRPKTLADFWNLQTIGLMMVTLASVLTSDFAFFFFLFVYLACLLACLTLFYLVRESRMVLGVGEPAQMPLFGGITAEERHLPLPPEFRLRTFLSWTTLLLGLGFGVFFLAPRQGNVQWVAEKLSSGAGSFRGSEGSMDLNRTGKVVLSNEVAFEVQVKNPFDQPALLPIEPLWVAEVLDFYRQGRWYSITYANEFMQSQGLLPTGNSLFKMALIQPPQVDDVPAEQLPFSIGGDQLYLSFGIMPRTTGHLVALSPFNWDLGINPYNGGVSARGSLFAFLEGSDSFVPLFQSRGDWNYYGQIVSRNPSKSFPAGPLRASYRDLIQDYRFLPREIGPFTRDLLLAQPEFSHSENLFDNQGLLLPQHHLRAAQVICEYLNSSGTYTYSLILRRKNTKIDPMVDFLLNVREGHCERYASGLTLMLRSLGIPCRLIKGYRGADPQGEMGRYQVRFSQAHSWVQVLVPGESPGSFRWLTLDPTPTLEASPDEWHAAVQWMDDSLQRVQTLWKNFVLDFTRDRQAQTFRRAIDLITATDTWILLGSAGLVLGLTGGGLWMWRHRPHWPIWTRGSAPTAVRSAGITLYHRFLEILTRHRSWQPAPGQTPREFSGELAARFSRDAQLAGFTDLPDRLTDLFYRTRFGGVPLTASDESSLTKTLADMERSMTISNQR